MAWKTISNIIDRKKEDEKSLGEHIQEIGELTAAGAIFGPVGMAKGAFIAVFGKVMKGVAEASDDWPEKRKK
jgi:hypothetical protein